MTALDDIMKDLHKANDAKDEKMYNFYRNLFIERWNENSSTKITPAKTGGMHTSDEVNIGGFWFKKAK